MARLILRRCLGRATPPDTPARFRLKCPACVEKGYADPNPAGAPDACPLNVELGTTQAEKDEECICCNTCRDECADDV